MPPMPQAERDAPGQPPPAVGALLEGGGAAALLVVAVLGSIVGGVAAPTEAASMGALGAILITVGSGRFKWAVLRDVALETSKITAIMMFILMMAQVFALAFRGLHGEDLIVRMFEWLPGGVNSDIWFMMALIFVLGFFIEWIEISYIAVPLFLPVLVNQGVDPVWLAMLITVNLQSSFLTPPFGWALFYLKGVAPPEVTSRTSTRACCPSSAAGLTLALVFCTTRLPRPSLVNTWLPKAIGWWSGPSAGRASRCASPTSGMMTPATGFAATATRTGSSPSWA
jgi:TRAP-type mannitol/chloroaromatic compound transport system permease large subunit